MAFRVIPVTPNETGADIAASGLRGFTQGRQQTLGDSLTRAKLEQLKRETQSFDQPVPEGFVRLPGGAIKSDPTLQSPFERALAGALGGQGIRSGVGSGSANIPTQIFNTTEEADASGQLPGTIVSVINPATGQPARYQI